MEWKCIISEKRLSVQIKANKTGFYLVGKPSGVLTGQNIVTCVESVSARVRRQSRTRAKQRERGRERGREGGGRGKGREKESFLFSPPTSSTFFCVKTRSGTFATQAKNTVVFCFIANLLKH